MAKFYVLIIKVTIKKNHLEMEVPFQNYWSFIPQKLVFYVYGSEVFISNNVYH